MGRVREGFVLGFRVDGCLGFRIQGLGVRTRAPRRF